MNSGLRATLPRLVGRTIAHVVVKEGTGPAAQLFLVFDDGTSYELYSDAPIDGAAGLDVGGLPAVLASGREASRVLFKC